MLISSYKQNPARIPALGARAFALLLLSLLLMFLDHRDNHLDAVRNAISAAVYPMRIIVAAPVNFWAWASDLSKSKKELQTENSRLRAEILLTAARLQRLTSLEAENNRLRDFLEARRRVQDEVRVVTIMAVDANPFKHNIVLDLGSSQGVYAGQAIINADGIIGVVMEAGPLTSDAILISDPGHALLVEVNRNGLRTLAYGTGEFGRLDLPGLPNNADIRTGDLLVTSGLGGTFPSGYPVAVVDTVTRIPQDAFAEVTATPTAALDQMREVMLIWSAQHDEQATNDE
ncbi:MAG: rod shape-determining protein MreC [Gammaproteobacteria bacterium]|nr:MAG: rod shape-determining protein MreC [Gammaproteobacteria bacterium]